MRERTQNAWMIDSNRKALLVSRISDRKQKDGVSLDAQQHELLAYAAANGLQVVASASFQESAKRSSNRKRFHAALAEGERLGARHVLFYMWDRVTRNFSDMELLEDMVEEGSIVLHVTSTRQVLYRGGDDTAFFTSEISVAQAKQENRTRKRKTIDGMVQRCRNGWFPGVPPTFYKQEPVLEEDGRMKKRGAVVTGPTSEGRALLRRQVELRLAGTSLPLIRATCLRDGLVPPKMIPRYRVSLIDRMLKNCFYAALARPHDGFISQFEWRGQWYEGKHEPVYTAGEWDALQESFGLRTPVRKRKHEGLFTSTLRLTCADPACECLVTYAPKQKGGREYRYYRCSDGKHLHANQVNVSEDDIIGQLGDAIDAISINERLATTIASALSETHRAATAAKRVAVESYLAQIEALKVKEDRAFDLLTDATLDREAYRRQVERIRAERDALFAKLDAAQREADDTYLVTADRVLELAKNAKNLWEARSPVERRDLVARLVCNLRLDGRTIEYQLQKPFAALARLRREVETMDAETQRAPTLPSRPSSHVANLQSAEWRPQRESKAQRIRAKRRQSLVNRHEKRPRRKRFATLRRGTLPTPIGRSRTPSTRRWRPVFTSVHVRCSMSSRGRAHRPKWSTYESAGDDVSGDRR